MPSQKLKTLKPRLQTLDVNKARGITMLKVPRANRTGRDADPSRTIKLNTAAWQKLRAHVLAGEPLCRHCTAAGKTVLATDVDHMNGASDNRIDSLQPLCHSCHSRKTARDQGKNVAVGCDVDGWPLDPHHPWNASSTADPEPQLSAVSGKITSNRRL